MILVKVAKGEIEKPVVQVTSGIQSVMWITYVWGAYFRRHIPVYSLVSLSHCKLVTVEFLLSFAS